MNIIKVIFEMRFVYEPLTHSIYELEDEKYQHKLAIPASLCLLSLLEHKNEVVSHSELLSQVWEARGMRVSTNTVYQNISLLRKSLADIGIQGEIVKTVPKRGFVISEDIMVEIHYDESFKDSDNKYFKNGDKEESGKKLVYGNIKNIFNALILILFLICFYIAYMELDSNPELPQYDFKEYLEINKFGDCHVFRNPSLRDDYFFYEIIAAYNLKCENETWWYFTNRSPNPGVSILRCTSKLDKKTVGRENFCYSDYYLDGVK